MAEGPMATTFSTALWWQLGAALDMLENALLACPEVLWHEHLWVDSEGGDYGTFWEITSHTLCWLDLYLTGSSFETFTPPTFKRRSDNIISKDELHTYLVQLRQKCQTTIVALSDEQAHRLLDYSWTRGKPVSYLEILLYTLRHVQEHAAQLSLFLGQHGISNEVLDWVPRMKDAGMERNVQ